MSWRKTGRAVCFDRVKHTTGGALGHRPFRPAPRRSDGIEDRLEDLQPQPVYTVPRNATLIGSTAMTALVGRVPMQGQVRDPMPFKVITGADNLAANGLRVPGVQGMVWSGTAIGDWTLSCVTGRLDSVTFVFDDGTIRTLSSDDRQSQGGGEDKPLGWISDAQGIPCVSGERKTNAPAFLSQRIGVMAIQAAGQAAAAAETTSVIGDSGSVTDCGHRRHRHLRRSARRWPAAATRWPSGCWSVSPRASMRSSCPPAPGSPSTWTASCPSI